MPHTSRQKRPTASASKRLQVTDDDGWTHVTSSNNVRRVLHKTRTKANGQDLDAQATAPDSLEKNASGEPELVLGPAEAPARLTLEELQAQYRGYREKWMASETWTRLEAQLKERIVSAQVDAVVCVGLGSPSGFLRGGWVDRRVVSMYQLAALESIAQWLSDKSSTRNIPIPIYAQDPVFNTLDKALLASLNMTVLTHPAAFTRLNRRTLLFCPGAERKHLEQLLVSEPCMVFGGPLEDTDSDVIQGFVGRVRSVVLGAFEECEHAFWKTRVYYREKEEGEGEGGVSVDV
ncbi:hypothetical protein F1880_006837 [Penicillium rolfsii]|nr:hypothetical protein F1880_006837 [Penicillium rolfsii]